MKHKRIYFVRNIDGKGCWKARNKEKSHRKRDEHTYRVIHSLRRKKKCSCAPQFEGFLINTITYKHCTRQQNCATNRANKKPQNIRTIQRLNIWDTVFVHY